MLKSLTPNPSSIWCFVFPIFDLLVQTSCTMHASLDNSLQPLLCGNPNIPHFLNIGCFRTFIIIFVLISYHEKFKHHSWCLCVKRPDIPWQVQKYPNQSIPCNFHLTKEIMKSKHNHIFCIWGLSEPKKFLYISKHGWKNYIRIPKVVVQIHCSLSSGLAIISKILLKLFDVTFPSMVEIISW